MNAAALSIRLPKNCPPNVAKVARRKLRQVETATTLADLRAPPNNKLEALKHERRGQHSIRVSNRWRICFVWLDGAARDVELVDYH